MEALKKWNDICRYIDEIPKLLEATSRQTNQDWVALVNFWKNQGRFKKLPGIFWK